MAEATNRQLQCTIVTPEVTVVNQAVDFVALPLYDGELGILPGRAPLVARLGYGELRARTAGATVRYYIDGGFLQVRDDAVSVLTARAIPADRVDSQEAVTELDAALGQVPTTDEAFEAKVISLSRARAQMRVARRAGKGA